MSLAEAWRLAWNVLAVIGLLAVAVSTWTVCYIGYWEWRDRRHTPRLVDRGRLRDRWRPRDEPPRVA